MRSRLKFTQPGAQLDRQCCRRERPVFNSLSRHSILIAPGEVYAYSRGLAKGLRPCCGLKEIAPGKVYAYSRGLAKG